MKKHSKIKQSQRIKAKEKQKYKAINFFVFLHKNRKKVWFIMSAQPSPACMTPQNEQEKVSLNFKLLCTPKKYLKIRLKHLWKENEAIII